MIVTNLFILLNIHQEMGYAFDNQRVYSFDKNLRRVVE